MADFDVTGTANWTSNCGADFGFLDNFLREKAHLGYVRRLTQDEMSQQVLDAYEHIQNASQTEADDMLSEMQQDTSRLNEQTFSEENVDPDDGVPAYMESKMQSVPTELSSADMAVVEERRQFYLTELYDALRTDGLYAYLSDDTMDVLNSDDFAFHVYDANMTRQEMQDALAQAKQEQPKETDLSHHRDYSKGFEMDEKGNEVDDGYGFGE